MTKAKGTLRTIIKHYDLSVKWFASQLGVSRQTIHQWIDTGIPDNRIPEAQAVLEEIAASLIDFRIEHLEAPNRPITHTRLRELSKITPGSWEHYRVAGFPEDAEKRLLESVHFLGESLSRIELTH